MIAGVSIKLGDTDYIVPPLNFRQLKALSADIKAITEVTSNDMAPESIDCIVRVVQAALSRNYPDLTAAMVEELIDMGNSKTVMAALLGASGFVSVGEAPAPQPSADQSTGTTSTAS